MVACGAAGAGWACGVCITLPEETLADRLLAAEVVVLARPDRRDQFLYDPVEQIAGARAGLANLPEVPFLIDSATRRALVADPDRGLVLTYRPERRAQRATATAGGWQPVFLSTPARLSFLHRVLEEGRAWPRARGADPARVAFFGSYLADADPMLRDAALAEISRAPYALIRSLAGHVPRAALAQNLAELDRVAYAPVTVLLLSLQADAATQARVRRHYQTVLKGGQIHLGAWALAALELDGAGVVPMIRARLLAPGTDHEARQELVRAMSEAGLVHHDLRDRMVPLLRAGLAADPALAAATAQAMYAWEDPALNAEFAALLQAEGLAPASEYILRLVLASGF